MAYNRPRRSSEPPSADTDTHSENTLPAAEPHAPNPRASGTPPPDGLGLAPEEQWSVVHPPTHPEARHGFSGNVQQQDQTPTPRPRNWNPSEPLRPLRKSLTSDQQQTLMERLQRDVDQGTAQPSQTRMGSSLSRPNQQLSNLRDFTAPIRLPRIPGSVLPYASRSPSGPEQRSPERPFYRPMSGVSPPVLAPTRQLQQQPSNGWPHGASRAPLALVSGNSNLQGDFIASNDSTSSDLSRALERMRLGFSPAYNGDPRLERNRSADVPNELNCSLFLVNLPPNLTTHRLITAVHAMGPTGRIYATHINAPEPDRQHFGCAAKVIFFERKAAHDFFSLCEEHGLVIDGFSARVMWNRIKTAQQAHSRTTTRVLLIGGNRQFVNPSALTEYFKTKLQFQIDCIIPHTDGMDGKNAVVEYRFGSFRCQAEAAKMALVREHQDVKCFFHPDPCDPSHPDWAKNGFRWPAPKLPRQCPTVLEVVPEDQEAQELNCVHDAAGQSHFPVFLR